MSLDHRSGVDVADARDTAALPGARPLAFAGSRADWAATALPVELFAQTAAGRACPAFQNDCAAPEIRIGARAFTCIGMSPPHDHPHVYIDMGAAPSILCPYCATRYRHDASLAPSAAEPAACAYVEPSMRADGDAGAPRLPGEPT